MITVDHGWCESQREGVEGEDRKEERVRFEAWVNEVERWADELHGGRI